MSKDPLTTGSLDIALNRTSDPVKYSRSTNLRHVTVTTSHPSTPRVSILSCDPVPHRLPTFECIHSSCSCLSTFSPLVSWCRTTLQVSVHNNQDSQFYSFTQFFSDPHWCINLRPSSDNKCGTLVFRPEKKRRQRHDGFSDGPSFILSPV